MKRLTLIKILGLIILFTPLTAFAINITVPQAQGTGGLLVGSSTGAYVASATTTWMFDIANTALDINGASSSNGFLNVSAGNSSYIASFIDSINSFGQVYISNKNSSGSSTTDLVLGNNLSVSSSTSNYADVGINGSTYSDTANFPDEGANDMFIHVLSTANNANIDIGPGDANGELRFGTGGFGTANRAMTIKSTGFVGVGTTTPTSIFSVDNGDISIGKNNYYRENGMTILAASTSGNAIFVGTGLTPLASLTGLSAVCIGNQACSSLTSGNRNVNIGVQAGSGNTTGSDNTFIGNSAGLSMGTSTSQDTVVGSRAMRNEHFVGGGNNVAVGYNSLFNASTTASNVALGEAAGFTLFGSSTNQNIVGNNIFIGLGADVTAAASTTLVNTTIIGTNVTTGQSNAIILGNTSVTGVGIGTSTPSSLFQVNSAATTTISLDNTVANKGSCIEMKDADGVGYTYISANNGVLTASVNSCK